METLKYFAQLHENTLIYGFTDMRVAGRLHEKCTNEHKEPRFYIIVVNLSLLPEKFRIMDPPYYNVSTTNITNSILFEFLFYFDMDLE